jgi:hypothetical protein
MSKSSPRSLAHHVAELLVALALLPVGGCDSASVWLSGVDRDNYSWEKVTGVAPPSGWQKDLAACELPGGQAAGVPAGQPTIARSESAEVVQRCMEAKGYHKVFQQRTGAL